MDLLTTHAQRLTARLSENLAERSKDLGLPLSLDALSNPTAAATGLVGGLGRGMWDDPKLLTSEGERETMRLLNGRNDKEREEGLRRVIVMMCKNRPVLSYFPAVTNCLHSPSFASTSASPSSALTTRQLVSLYILRHATSSPDLALLSVNAYQKDLSDPNPAIRALALRTLAGMGLDTVAPLVLMSVNKAVRDGNWWVRRAACDAVVAVHALDPRAHAPGLVSGAIPILLADGSALVLGSAVEAWEQVCPGRYDLLHPQFRRCCRVVADADEWGQVILLRVLTRYSRSYFRDPNAPSATLDPDLDLFLRSAAVLLQSQNPAVVSAAAHAFCFLAPATRLPVIAPPLVRMVRLPASEEMLLATLQDISIIASQRKDMFAPYLPHFYIFSSDSPSVKSIKLRILVALAEGSAATPVLNELTHYVRDSDERFAGDAIAAVGEVARGSTAVTSQAMKLLIKLSRSKSPTVVSQAVLAIRSLLRHTSQATSRLDIIRQLVGLLLGGSVTSAAARATIYWLVGQHSTTGSPLLDSTAPDLIRLGLRDFGTEPPEAKLQILALSAKCLVSSHLAPLPPHRRFYALAFRHATVLARYDADYEVRDRARFLAGLVDSAGIGASDVEAASKVALTEDAFSRGELLEQDQTVAEGRATTVVIRAEEVRQILFDRKAAPAGPTRSTTTTTGRLGSLSALTHHPMHDPNPLPGWTNLVVDPRVRDAPEGPSAASAQSSGGTALRGFGSDSFRHGGSSPSGRASPVVLVPTGPGSSFATPRARPSAPKQRVQKLNDFLGDSESGSEEEESDEESGEEGESESEEGTESEESDEERIGLARGAT